MGVTPGGGIGPVIAAGAGQRLGLVLVWRGGGDLRLTVLAIGRHAVGGRAG